MPDYFPPLKDMRFVLEHVVGLSSLPAHPDLGVIDGEMTDAILDPAAKLAAEVLAPINHRGDQEGASLKTGDVTTAPGWKEAYAAYREGGWNAVPFSPEFGGQGLPWLLAFAVQEMWQGANMSFGLCPLLNQGAVEAIESHGSAEQKSEYLEKLISGEWTGTMNLTEPQAGSDLSAIRSKAVLQEDGSYKITGQKIFITYGEHDLAENIIHLVLARTPDAPEGVKGISLFIVPKILKDGRRNDVVCAGLEHKLGIHASPTCTMVFGEKDGAVGYLIGAEHEGLKYMFTMMNNARLSVGLQGVAIAEAACQKAVAYAKDRQQGKKAIIEYADVKRMLLTMRSLTQAGRALTYEAALKIDLARGGDEKAQARVDLLTPLVKAWCTDLAQEVTSLGVQVHGGTGFIEETGAAQFFRDARILPIYEGTNGIQAADLVFRKVLRDGGAAAKAYLQEIQDIFDGRQAETLEAVEQATDWILETGDKNPEAVAAASSAYLKSFAVLAGGAMMKKSARAAREQLEAGEGDSDFLTRKIETARFYMQQVLPVALISAQAAMSDPETVLGAKF